MLCECKKNAAIIKCRQTLSLDVKFQFWSTIVKPICDIVVIHSINVFLNATQSISKEC